MKRKPLDRGFLSLIVTQFFGAANDNILKGVLIYMVIDGAWQGMLGSGGQGIVSVCFTVPFILLSGYAGQFADRNSKRYVSTLVKILEIPIAGIALVGFWTENLWVTLLALIALTCQSAFFGPAKYGMIPELVDSSNLSRANGTINMMTNLAVIIGTLAAGKIADVYCPQPIAGLDVAEGAGWSSGVATSLVAGAGASATGSLPQLIAVGQTAAGSLWLPGAAMLVVAVAGLCAVLFLPPLEPGDRKLKYDLNPLATYIESLKDMAATPLLMVMLAWGYFYFLAGLALLIIPEYTKVLGVSRTDASVLLGVMGVAIGTGSAFAGLISGHAIRPRLIPIGAVGLTIFFALLGTVPPTLSGPPGMLTVLFSWVSCFTFGAGFFAGFYIIPLQALLQRLSPDDERGRMLGTANGVSFSFLTLASIVYWVIRPAFGTEKGHEHPEKIFLISAVLMIVGATFFLWRMGRRGFSFDKVE